MLHFEDDKNAVTERVILQHVVRYGNMSLLEANKQKQNKIAHKSTFIPTRRETSFTWLCFLQYNKLVMHSL